MPFNKLSNEIWTYEFNQKIPFLFGTCFPARSTILKSPDQTLTLISPGPMSTDDLKELEDIGRVTSIVAPNKFHHLHIPQALKCFPNAAFYGPVGLSKKKPRLANRMISLEEAHQNVSEIIDWYPLHGNSFSSEWAAIHRASKTLIVTDLVFNMGVQPSKVTNLVLKSVGCLGKLSQSKLIRLTTHDHKIFAQSMINLCNQDWNTLIMAHGKIRTDGDKARDEMLKIAQNLMP